MADDDPDIVLGNAFGLAKQFQSQVVGIYVRPPPGEFIPSGDFGMALSQDYLERLHRESASKAARFKAAFQDYAGKLGIKPADGTTTGSGMTAEWIDAEGSASLLVGSFGRVFDLIILRKPDTKLSAETEILLEAALFESGRPILMVSRTEVPTFRGTSVIAWNGSTESARMVALGMPLLRVADRTVVITVEGGSVPGPSGADLTTYLNVSGVSATHRHINPDVPNSGGGQVSGEIFLREAEKMNADILFKGAYTQSRLRQLIFGGATRHLLLNAQMPVFLAH